MDDAAIDAMHAVSGRSFDGFTDATRAVLEMLEGELDGSALFVAHLDDEQNTMRIIDAGGEGSYGLAAGSGFPLDASFCVHMAADRSPRLSNDAEADPNYAAAGVREPMGIKSYVGVPLEVGGGSRVGSLCAISHETDHYSDRDLKLLTVMGRLLANELERDTRERRLEAASETLRALALTDALTGLGNRRGFEDALQREWTLSRERRLTDTVLVGCDVDGLKQVNDERGHAAGDRALKCVAAALTAEARGADIAARLGGDEFGVLLVGCPAVEAGEQWGERVRERLSASGTEFGPRFGLSVGVAALWEAETPAAALEEADRRMYLQKQSSYEDGKRSR